MNLTEDDIDILRDSLRVMNARRTLLADIFYDRLFEIDPSLRALFDDDIQAQTDKVLFAFGAVVAQIHDIEACRDMTRELALRHVDYGVVAPHYATVGVAVMATLAEVFDDEFTPELAAVWRLAYDQIATAMIASAYGEATRTAA